MENRVTCDTCKANRVCDHNRFGFETCGNYIPSDVVPRAEFDALIKNYAECMKDYAREIFAELDTFFNLLCTDNDDILIYSEIRKKYLEGSGSDDESILL